jgi:hypothetical protein
MFAFALRPGEQTTRARVVAEVAARLGRNADRIRAHVNTEIDAAVQSGTLVEQGSQIETSDSVTSWVLHSLPPEDQSPDQTT